MAPDCVRSKQEYNFTYISARTETTLDQVDARSAENSPIMQKTVNP